MFQRAILSLCLLLAATLPGMAQIWPANTVRIVVPFGAGSTPDIVARLVAEGLARKYPASAFLVENRPGASGNLGTDLVAKATADGATLGISIGGPLAINTLLFAKLPYDPAKDIAAITQLVTQPSALAVNPQLNVDNVAELVALLKANPGKYNFASIGNGSLSHLAMEAIALKAGAPLVHVPYPSSPQAITAVIRNDAQIACLPAISVTPQAAAGKVKILAVSTSQRSPYLPDVPTLKEAGIDVEADAWNGLIAPGGTPPAIVAAINRDVVEIIQRKDVRDKLATQLMTPVGSSPQAFRALIDREVARWRPVIEAAKIKIN
ncbi:MAG: tripartite tricarboxylate transporter substrate binding protein [Rhizobiales bacterium]|nr:tripartite tricarboxylate transporter substrate binding protein [Hyphomicrobiales bacterium]